MVLDKRVPQIVDVRDESTDEVRIVLELKRGESAEVAMAYLYRHTPLQQNFNINLTCLVPAPIPAIISLTMMKIAMNLVPANRDALA